jgi:hypothetical protein
MSDKLPTREEAKNHANMFRYYVSDSGKAACDVLTAYASGLLQPTQTYSEEELLGMMPPEKEIYGVLEEPVINRRKGYTKPVKKSSTL